jgi:hypothetical protein
MLRMDELIRRGAALDRNMPPEERADALLGILLHADTAVDRLTRQRDALGVALSAADKYMRMAPEVCTRDEAQHALRMVLAETGEVTGQFIQWRDQRGSLVYEAPGRIALDEVKS